MMRTVRKNKMMRKANNKLRKINKVNNNRRNK